MTTVRERITKDTAELIKRPRRLRGGSAMRALVAETALEPRHFIAPFFVISRT